MKIAAEGMLLRIFIGEDDRFHGKPLYEQIVLQAQKLGLAGATVTRGIMGFGADSRMHTAKVLRLTENLPVVVEFVDMEENLEKLIPFIDEAVQEGMVTLEKVRLVKHWQPKEQ